MANGTLSSPAAKVTANNLSVLQVGVSGGTWAGTLVIDASKVHVTVTSDGYTANSLGTHTRTPRALKVTYAGGNFTIHLSEPLFNDDTATVVFDAGAIVDGTDTTLALGSTAVDFSTNTYDYPTVTTHIISPSPWSRQTGSFTVWVEAAGARFDDRPGTLGIEQVDITVTDGTTTVGPTAATFGLRDRYNSNGKYAKHPGWYVTFNASSFANKTMGTITATAYPTFGDAASLRAQTRKVWLNKDNDAAVQTAYVDESYTIAGSGSGTFTDLEIVTQTTSGTIGIVWGSGQGGGGSLTVAALRGGSLADAANVWTGATSGKVWTPSGAPVAVASGGAINDANTPYPNLARAMEACEDTRFGVDGTRKSSFSTVYVKTPYTVGTDLGAGNRPNTSDGPCYIRPWSGESASRILCNGNSGTTTAGLRTACIELYDHTVVRLISAQSADTALVGGSDQAIGFVNMTFDGTKTGGYTTATTLLPTTTVWADAIWYVGSYLTNHRTGMMFQNGMVLDCRTDTIGEDVVTTTNNGALVNCNIGTLVAGGAHASVWQSLGAGNVNRGAYFCDFTNLDVTATYASAGVFTAQGATDELTSAAVVGCTFPDLIANTRREGIVASVFQWFSTLGRENWADGGTDPLFTNIYYYGCAIHNITGDQATWLSPYVFRNCHDFGTQVATVLGTWPGEENTAGSTPAAAFVSPTAGGDWTAKASGVLLDRVLAAYQDSMTYDAQGRLLSQDVSALAAIGALQPTPTLTATYDGDSVSDGGTVTESAGTKELRFTVGGPTGAVAYVSSVTLGGTVTGTDGSPYTLTVGGSVTEGVISTTLTAGAGTVDIAWDLSSVFDFDITGSSPAGSGGFRSRSRGRGR